MSSKGKLLKEIASYYNTAHLLRPVSASLVDTYKEALTQGSVFPAIVLGEYPGQDGTIEKIIVDGVHTFRAASLAKVTRIPAEVQTYSSLAEALADQLKRNLHHGMQLHASERDARIRMLQSVYKWGVKKIATSVGLHYSSISRIANGKQNKSGTGKSGPNHLTASREEVAILPLGPRPFLRTMERLHVTLSKAPTRKEIQAVIRSEDEKEKDALIALLKKVVAEVEQLLSSLDFPALAKAA